MNREDNFFLTQFIFSLITEMDLVNKFWILTVGFIFCYVVRVFGELNCFSCDGDKSLSDCERTQFERLSCKKINKTAACYIVQRFTKKGKGPSFGKHCTTLEMCKKNMQRSSTRRLQGSLLYNSPLQQKYVHCISCIFICKQHTVDLSYDFIVHCINTSLKVNLLWLE